MKVNLSVEVRDDQRRALSGGKRLATRDEVRSFVEGALAALGQQPAAEIPLGAAAAATRAASAPSTDDPTLEEKVREKKALGWTVDQLASYRRGWHIESKSR